MKSERTFGIFRRLSNLVRGEQSEQRLPAVAREVPLVHYLQSGAAAGLSPHPVFDPAWYRERAHVSASEDALSHYIREGDAAGLSPHPLFDPIYYREQTPALSVSKAETSLAHYLREGEVAGRRPHPLFHPRWYRIQVPDLPASESALCHYLREGDRRGLSPHPLFDPAWYRGQGAQVRASESALGHYLREGDRCGLSPHPLFDPAWYRWKHRVPAGDNALVHLLQSGFDPEDLIAYLDQHPQLKHLTDHPLLRRLRGPLESSDGAPLAAPAMSGPRLMRSDNRLLRSAGRQYQPNRPALARQASSARIVVYTCCYGSYESLKEPETTDPALRFIAFTDDPDLRSERWEICVLNDHLSNARRSSRLPKILPHLYLPDHDVSIYIDASLQWRAENVHGMVAECLEGQDMGLYPHSRRDCVYDEIDVCESLEIEHRELISFYRSHYEELGLPRHAGLFEHGLIVRRNTAATRTLNEQWWRMYRGERDQLSLMSAIRTTNTAVNAIKYGKQVRTNPYVTFVKHERRRLPEKRPKLYVFIAYAPPSYQQDLGRAYNDYMSLIEDDAFALFLDHDAMFCSPDWFQLLQQVMSGYEGVECLIVGRTNRIGNPYQRVGVLSDDHGAVANAALAKCLADTQRDWMANVSQLDSTSGVVLMLSKATWQKHPFSPGFLKVDNRMHIGFRDAGRPVFMPSSLYVYHFYRADGDSSHAVRLEQTVSPASGADVSAGSTEHRLKNFIYDEAAGLDFAHYQALLGAGEWAIFLRRDAMFCDKYWYTRAYAALGRLPEQAIVAFGSNLRDAEAPQTDDIRAHRDHAAGRVASGALRPRSAVALTQDDLVAFMVDQATLAQLVEGGGRNTADLLALLQRQAIAAFDDESTHVFCQAAPAAAAAEPPSEAALAQALANNRRIAILTLGFWPSQAGMELMIHNLAVHLTEAGDLVTLYAPKPQKAYEEIPHNYLLKRFKSEEHFLEMFRKQHAVLPVDAILVQGGLEAASMALKLKDELGVAVILRTHGEDIQVDEGTGYGYRRDPAKRAIIDSNIRRVDRNVVIGEHIAPLVREIAPEAVVKTIHNGVDIKRFRPQPTRYLRDRLGLSDDKLILLTVGRNVKKKALHLAIHALQRVLQRVPQAVLVHAGKEGNGENLAETARQLGVEHAFFSLGEVDYFDTPLLYASADLFVFPSKVETFGNVTVEALSSGLPCVEFDYEVNRQKISSGLNGYVIPFGEVEQMADRVVELLIDPEKRRAFSAEARQAAVDTFAWSRVAENYRAVFREFRSTQATRPQPTRGYGTAPLLGAS